MQPKGILKTLHQRKGFSLVELLVVIAIVGILGTFAYPAYRNYIVRSNLVSALNMLSAYKIKVSEYYMKNYTFPPGTEGTPFFPTVVNPTPEIASLSWYRMSASQGQLIATFNSTIAEIDARELWLRADLVNGDLKWTCMTSSNAGQKIENQYLPENCHI